MLDTFIPLKAPFPWFGGKSRVAHIVWDRFGDIPNYVEPFFGSGAVTLGRPNYNPQRHLETVNDADCYLANFWRSIALDPSAVAKYADWPVNETDLHARHLWLVNQSEFKEKMTTNPEYFDPKIAGWWVWGICAWIGGEWCEKTKNQLPHLGNAGRGVQRRLPHLGSAGRGVNRKSGNGGLYSYFEELSDRLRRVRVCCGDWSRVLGDSVTYKNGITAVFLDPPYSKYEDLYNEGKSVSNAVREWAIANGDNPKLRIALCGYEGEHVMPDSWECVAWKANGGYANKGYANNDNRSLERIWFSPHCLKPIATLPLFSLELQQA